MQYYPSKNNDRINARPFAPEAVNGCVMLNPVYPIRFLSPRCKKVKCDSGAFQGVMDGTRCMPFTALERQLRFERVLQELNPHFTHFETVFVYDQPAGIDEAVINGRKVKVRGTRATAARAVQQTLEAAALYAQRRDDIQGRIGFVGQGIDPDQYINDCLMPLLDLMRPGDEFAFGGFCIIGRVPSLKPLFYETVDRALPILKRHGIDHVHLLGVTVTDASRIAFQMARREGLTLSVDSSSPEVNACAYGKRFVDEKWKPAYCKADKFIAYHPNDLAIQNISDYHEWSAAL